MMEAMMMTTTKAAISQIPTDDGNDDDDDDESGKSLANEAVFFFLHYNGASQDCRERMSLKRLSLAMMLSAKCIEHIYRMSLKRMSLATPCWPTVLIDAARVYNTVGRDQQRFCTHSSCSPCEIAISPSIMCGLVYMPVERDICSSLRIG